MERPKRNNDASWKKLGDKTLILSTRIDGQMHELNSTGDFLWQLCDGRHSMENITRKFREHYGLNEQQAREDVEAFLNQLARKKLLFDQVAQ